MAVYYDLLAVSETIEKIFGEVKPELHRAIRRDL